MMKQQIKEFWYDFTEKVEIVKVNQVSEEFARSEGEGDLSYQYWYDTHVEFFTAQLKPYGKSFSDEIELVCQQFEVKYKC